jgi:hypothetical protein
MAWDEDDRNWLNFLLTKILLQGSCITITDTMKVLVTNIHTFLSMSYRYISSYHTEKIKVTMRLSWTRLLMVFLSLYLIVYMGHNHFLPQLSQFVIQYFIIPEVNKVSLNNPSKNVRFSRFICWMENNILQEEKLTD